MANSANSLNSDPFTTQHGLSIDPRSMQSSTSHQGPKDPSGNTPSTLGLTTGQHNPNVSLNQEGTDPPTMGPVAEQNNPQVSLNPENVTLSTMGQMTVQQNPKVSLSQADRAPPTMQQLAGQHNSQVILNQADMGGPTVGQITAQQNPQVSFNQAGMAPPTMGQTTGQQNPQVSVNQAGMAPPTMDQTTGQQNSQVSLNQAGMAPLTMDQTTGQENPQASLHQAGMAPPIMGQMTIQQNPQVSVNQAGMAPSTMDQTTRQQNPQVSLNQAGIAPPTMDQTAGQQNPQVSLNQANMAPPAMGQTTGQQNQQVSLNHSVPSKRQTSREETATAASNSLPPWMPVAKTNDPTKDPEISYLHLCAAALLSFSAPTLLPDIYDWIEEHFPYYKESRGSWKNSVRHSLSTEECFIKTHKAPRGKGYHWWIHEAFLPHFKQGNFDKREIRRKIIESTQTFTQTNTPSQTGYHPYMASTPRRRQSPSMLPQAFGQMYYSPIAPHPEQGSYPPNFPNIPVNQQQYQDPYATQGNFTMNSFWETEQQWQQAQQHDRHYPVRYDRNSLGTPEHPNQQLIRQGLQCQFPNAPRPPNQQEFQHQNTVQNPTGQLESGYVTMSPHNFDSHSFSTTNLHQQNNQANSTVQRDSYQQYWSMNDQSNQYQETSSTNHEESHQRYWDMNHQNTLNEENRNVEQNSHQVFWNMNSQGDSGYETLYQRPGFQSPASNNLPPQNPQFHLSPEMLSHRTQQQGNVNQMGSVYESFNNGSSFQRHPRADQNHEMPHGLQRHVSRENQK